MHKVQKTKVYRLNRPKKVMLFANKRLLDNYHVRL